MIQNSSIEKLDSERSEEKIETFWDWNVSLNGDMIFRPTNYQIKSERLSEEDWIIFNDFIPAYLQACKNTEIQSITMNLYINM